MANSLLVLHEKIKHCSECGNLTEEDPCSICVDPFRNRKLLCVVETQEDCVAMEQSTVFDGLYHVLGGRFSPLDEETIPSESLLKLKDRIMRLQIKEVVLAVTPRIEGDLTAYAVKKELENCSVKVTRLAYGLPVGGSIGFADRSTLHVALESRKEVEISD